MLPLLHLWIDPVPKDGPMNMAVDEWLAENCEVPVLRSYLWEPGWGSFGYFVKAHDLPDAGLRWVRRWTGGGIVDHRGDWTYTLFVPRGFGLSEARGAESYRIIHLAVAAALESAGRKTKLAGISAPAVGGECFIQPVEHDLLDATGRKIAGAGQRRSKRGLLHQGSVMGTQPFGYELSGALSQEVEERVFVPPEEDMIEKASARYRASVWTNRR